jgi:hypothetical protein
MHGDAFASSPGISTIEAVLIPSLAGVELAATPNEIRRRRSPVGDMVLRDDGVLIHTLDEGAVVDRRAATQVLRDTEKIAEGRPIAVVVDLRAIAFADQESRRVFADDAAGGVEVATALVVGPRVGEYLGAQFVNRARPHRPTSIFRDVDEAAAWASDRVREASGGATSE